MIVATNTVNKDLIIFAIFLELDKGTKIEPYAPNNNYKNRPIIPTFVYEDNLFTHRKN